MPYIKEADRQSVEQGWVDTPGALAFVLTAAVDRYLAGKELCYEDYNEVIGVLESVKLEYYRRILAPYEDDKRYENGDVYSIAPKKAPKKGRVYVNGN